jgi:hypothetical protein
MWFVPVAFGAPPPPDAAAFEGVVSIEVRGLGEPDRIEVRVDADGDVEVVNLAGGAPRLICTGEPRVLAVDDANRRMRVVDREGLDGVARRSAAAEGPWAARPLEPWSWNGQPATGTRLTQTVSGSSLIPEVDVWTVPGYDAVRAHLRCAGARTSAGKVSALADRAGLEVRTVVGPVETRIVAIDARSVPQILPPADYELTGAPTPP